jgi:hypothetical protein
MDIWLCGTETRNGKRLSANQLANRQTSENSGPRFLKVDASGSFSILSMASYTYRNDLLAPYLALPQGDKIQAECMLRPPYAFHSVG